MIRCRNPVLRLSPMHLVIDEDRALSGDVLPSLPILPLRIALLVCDGQEMCLRETRSERCALFRRSDHGLQTDNRRHAAVRDGLLELQCGGEASVLGRVSR